MTGWYAQRRPDGSAKTVIAMALLALLLVAAVPVALLAGVVMVFGASVLAAAVAVAFAGVSGLRHVRKLVAGFGVVPLDDNLLSGSPESRDHDYANVVHLDRSEYTEVR
jgi:hypothetical protein